MYEVMYQALQSQCLSCDLASVMLSKAASVIAGDRRDPGIPLSCKNDARTEGVCTEQMAIR